MTILLGCTTVGTMSLGTAVDRIGGQADAAWGPAGSSMSSAKTAINRPLLITAIVRIMAVLAVARENLNFGTGCQRIRILIVKKCGEFRMAASCGWSVTATYQRDVEPKEYRSNGMSKSFAKCLMLL